jgi:hypothetical protein
MTDEPWFPIQGQRVGRVLVPAGQVPWAVAKLAYQTYAKHYGTGQSLERLAERGGFGWTELVNLLADTERNQWIELPVAPGA